MISRQVAGLIPRIERCRFRLHSFDVRVGGRPGRLLELSNSVARSPRVQKTKGENIVRFLSIYKTAETNTPPTPEHIATMQKLVEEGMKAGWLVATEGCLPSSKGARVKRSGEKTTVTDGPFTESKELVAGFAILQAASKQEAIELTRKFLAVAGEGECEVRQIFTPTDQEPGCVATELAEQFANT